VIGLTEFATGASRKVRAATRRLIARGATGLVLDLRENPGGYVKEAVGTAGVFLPRGAVVVRESGLHWRPTTLHTRVDPVTTRVPLTVLVNGQSASAAEIVASALHDHRRAGLVGSRTFGKGVIQDVFPLSGGSELKLTIAEYRTPSGTVIQHRGIAPDLVSYDDPRTRADDVLQRAIRALRSR
jgi:carboxyl-terminal processing protease